MIYCNFCMMPLEESDTECPFCGKAREGKAPPHHLPYGTVLNGKYLVGAAIGEGGFGITYIGRDSTLEIKVAIKEYFPGICANRANTESLDVHDSVSADKKELFAKGKEAFLSEARALARFSDEKGIVNVREYFQANNTAYIVMEYLEGETLKEYLDHKGKLSPDSVLEILDPVINSLKEIHRSGLIHRDISPQNIILSKKGAKLLDFGAARYVDSHGDNSYSVILKPGYAPEEQYRRKGDQGSWTDVYGLCATIYKCVTGIIPDASLERLLKDEIKAPSTLGISVEPNFERALMKGMSVLKKDRYKTIDELMDGFAGKDNSLNKVPSDNDVTVYLSDAGNTSAKEDTEDDDRTYKLSNEQLEKMIKKVEHAKEPVSSESVQPVISQDKPEDTQKKAAEQVKETVQPKKEAPKQPAVPPQVNEKKPPEIQPVKTQQPNDQNAAVKSSRSKMIIAAIVAVVIIGGGIAAFVLSSGKGGNNIVSVKEEDTSSYVDVSVTETSSQADISSESGEASAPTSVTLSNKEIDKQTVLDLCDNPKLDSIIINNCTFGSDVSFEDLPERLVLLKIIDCKELPSTEGVNKLTSLSTLKFINCSLTDEQLASIDFKKLSKLAYVELDQNNGITKADPLGDITGLKTLSVNGTGINNFAALSGLTGLYELKAENCGISDLSSLSNGSIKILYLGNNNIKEITSLGALTNLTQLYLNNNALSSISALSEMKELTVINVNRNKLGSLTGLEKAIKLKEIYAAGNELTDLNGISNCTILTQAAFNDNKLTNADVLQKSKATLLAVDLRNNQLTDISFLKDTAKLQNLYLDYNKIKSLAPLSGSKELYELSASNNVIENASEIWELEKLKNIVLDNNKITDVNGILSFDSGYKLLSLNNNSISELVEINVNGVGVDVLMLCSNPIKASSLGEKKNKFSGNTLYISYSDGMDFNNLWAKFNFGSIYMADYPLDKQLAFEEDAKKSNKTPYFENRDKLQAQINSILDQYIGIETEGFESITYSDSTEEQ